MHFSRDSGVKFIRLRTVWHVLHSKQFPFSNSIVGFASIGAKEPPSFLFAPKIFHMIFRTLDMQQLYLRANIF